MMDVWLVALFNMRSRIASMANIVVCYWTLAVLIKVTGKRTDDWRMLAQINKVTSVGTK